MCACATARMQWIVVINRISTYSCFQLERSLSTRDKLQWSLSTREWSLYLRDKLGQWSLSTRDKLLSTRDKTSLQGTRHSGASLQGTRHSGASLQGTNWDPIYRSFPSRDKLVSLIQWSLPSRDKLVQWSLSTRDKVLCPLYHGEPGKVGDRFSVPCREVGLCISLCA